MAYHKKKSSKRGAKKGRAKGRKKGTAKKGRRKGVTRAGKVRAGASLSTVAAALNRIESRVDRLEYNDSANQALWLNVINRSRKGAGKPALSHVPGFAKPRLFRGLKSGTARALPR